MRSAIAASVDRAREEAARPEHQHGQEGEMAGEDLPFRIDRGADRLRDADDDAAGERAPQAAEPADDHRLEGVDQPRRADGRIEVGADAEEERRRRRRRPSRAPWRWRRCVLLSMPISCAVSVSSEMARKARPSAVR